jgi:hypothetical protein
LRRTVSTVFAYDATSATACCLVLDAVEVGLLDPVEGLDRVGVDLRHALKPEHGMVGGKCGRDGRDDSGGDRPPNLAADVEAGECSGERR